MFDINPFAELSHSISPAVMQGFVIAMAVCVAGGTLYDVIHKGSAKYFLGLLKRALPAKLVPCLFPKKSR